MLSVRDKIHKLHDFAATDGLPEWEDNFINSICSQMEYQSWDTTRLSGKQVEKIEELYERRIVRDTGGSKRFYEKR